MNRITALPAFKDNYIWAWTHDDEAVVVDPGDAAPVRDWLGRSAARLRTVLVTHWHPDHTGGIAELVAETGAQVVGPAQEANRIPTLDRQLRGGDTVDAGGLRFEVMEVPGHTLGHIAFFAPVSPPILFCGDTLFHTGCGRLFEGTPEQMHTSLEALAALPDDTLVYCTHEYTLANLAFARAVEANNPALAEAQREAEAQRAAGEPTVPTTMGAQRRFNPFLRAHEPDLQQAIAERAGQAASSTVEHFALLRELKDRA